MPGSCLRHMLTCMSGTLVAAINHLTKLFVNLELVGLKIAIPVPKSNNEGEQLQGSCQPLSVLHHSSSSREGPEVQLCLDCSLTRMQSSKHAYVSLCR